MSEWVSEILSERVSELYAIGVGTDIDQFVTSWHNINPDHALCSSTSFQGYDEHEPGFIVDMPQDLNTFHGDITVSLLMQGWTPMHCAADILHPEVVELLLKSCSQEAVNAADNKVLPSLDA